MVSTRAEGRKPLEKSAKCLVLSAQEVGEMLGLSEASVYRAAHAGTLPGVIRVGRRVSFSRAKIERLAEEGMTCKS